MTSPAALPRRRRVLTLAVWALLVVLALLQVARSDFSADLSAFLPARPDARQRLLIEQIHSGVPSRTLLVAIGGGDAATRAGASRALAAALRGNGRFVQVSNGEQQGWSGTAEWLFEHRYALSPAVSVERFSADGLRSAIAESLSLLGTPAGQAVKPLLERDPSGETQRIVESLLPVHAPRSEQGVWVSRTRPGQGDRALLMATVEAPGADIDGQAAAIADLRRAFEPLAARGLTLQLSGAPVFSVDSRARVEGEVHRLAGLGSLLVGALLVLAFASLAALGAAVLPVATGVLCGVAAVSVGFDAVHSMTLAFGAALIGESVDYAIYYLVQSHGDARGHGGWRAWLHGSWPTVRLGLATSVCGFAALVFSGFPGLAQLGVFSVAGLIGAALTTRWLLPALLPDGARGTGARRALARAAAAVLHVLPRLRRPLLLLGAAAAVLLVQRGELWRADLGSLSPVPRAAIELDEQLRADLGAGGAGTLVVVQGPDVQTTLQRAEAVAERLEGLVDRGVLAGFDSVTRLVPSRDTQQRRLAALPEAAALEAALRDATRGGPLSAQRLAPFLDEVAQARRSRPFEPQDLQGGPLAPLVDALLTRRDDGSASALLPVHAAGESLQPPALEQIRGALRGLPDARLLDIGQELRTLYQSYLGEAQGQALLGGLGVLVLIALWLRSWRRVRAVCEPLVLAVLLTMGAWAAAGAQLGILHLVGLLLVVAVGSNYALFFDMLHHAAPGDGQAGEDTLASLVLANLTTVLSFGLLALSDIPLLAAIGRVVAPGALLALLLAAACAPPRRAPGGAGQGL